MPTPIDTALRREIAARLKHARERLRYTSSAMAREMGATPQRWFNYETGRRPFDLPMMIAFCQRFALTTDYLIRGSKAGLTDVVQRMLAVEDPPLPVVGTRARLTAEFGAIVVGDSNAREAVVKRVRRKTGRGRRPTPPKRKRPRPQAGDKSGDDDGPAARCE